MKTTLENIMTAALSANEESKARALDVLTGTPEAVPSHKPAEPFMTLKEVGKALGFHYTSLWRYGVPGHDLGGRRRFRISEVQAYLESPEFKARVAELKAERKAKTQNKKDA